MDAVNVATAVLEVHERSGALRERVRLDPQRPLRIGRALDNDLIIDDAWICPHHAELRFESGGFVLVDLDSVNGLRKGPHSPRQSRIELAGRVSLRLGQTELLFRDAGEVLAPSRADASDHWLAQGLRSVAVGIVALLLLAGLVGLQQFIGQSEHQRWLPALSEALSVVVMVLVWALAWAIVNRLFAHRLQYPGHLTIAALGLLAVLLLDVLAEYLLYALAADGLLSWSSRLLVYGGLAATLWAHLGLLAGHPGRKQVGAALAVSLLLFGLFSLPDMVDDDFRSEPDFHALLKPPAFQLAEGLPVDHFYTRAQGLAEALQAEVAQSAEGAADDSR